MPTRASSGIVDPKSKTCFEENPHRHVTLLFKVAVRSPGHAPQSLESSVQVTENVGGGKKVLVRMFTCPELETPFDEGEYDLD